MESLLSMEGVERAVGRGPERKAVLSGIHLTVARGEFLAVMGPSGEGKTTLLRILALREPFQKGSYRLLGQDVGSLWRLGRGRQRRRFAARHVGYVSQGAYLLPNLTALDNVAQSLAAVGMPPAMRREEARRVLEQFGVSHVARRYPDSLSGGEARIVALARAVAHRPELVLVDEPTSGLDGFTRDRILRLLEELVAGGLTIVLATHDVQVAVRARRVMRLREGRLAEDPRHGR